MFYGSVVLLLASFVFTLLWIGELTNIDRHPPVTNSTYLVIAVTGYFIAILLLFLGGYDAE